MIALNGYSITERLHDSDRSVIYRAVRETDMRPVILKSLQDELPPPEAVEQFAREYELTRSLDAEGIIEVLGYEMSLNRPVMILEDAKGRPLTQWIQSHKFSLTEILTIGLKIAVNLGHIHQQHIIHNHLTPANLIYDPASQALKLIDFGRSAKTFGKNQDGKHLVSEKTCGDV